jgi:hypothetical protein
MADNIAVTPGVGATVAADDVSGVLYQRTKLAVGADGSASDWDGTVEVSGGGICVDGWNSHDDAITGAPIRIGAYAQEDGAPTSVSADADAVSLIADRKGRLWIRPISTDVFATSDLIQRQTLVKKTVDFTASQTAQTIWTPASGKKFVVVQAIVSFSAAGALAVFDSADDTTNRILKLNGAANGGMAWTAAIPVISATADNVLKYTTGAGAAGSLTVFGYEA